MSAIKRRWKQVTAQFGVVGVLVIAVTTVAALAFILIVLPGNGGR